MYARVFPERVSEHGFLYMLFGLTVDYDCGSMLHKLRFFRVSQQF